MRLSALVSSVALAFASVSHADIFQYEDCDGNGSLLLTGLDAVPGVDLSGLYLGCADLTGADLSGADLSGADLTAAKLYGADLRNAILRNANLTNAKLNGADLNGADLSYANLTVGDLRNANLSSADLWYANLMGAKLSGADLTGATGLVGWLTEITDTITGSCCLPTGCTTISDRQCTEIGGTWTEDGSCDDCSSAPTSCAADLSGDGIVGFDDLVNVISNWGVCP